MAPRWWFARLNRKLDRRSIHGHHPTCAKSTIADADPERVTEVRFEELKDVNRPPITQQHGGVIQPAILGAEENDIHRLSVRRSDDRSAVLEDSDLRRRQSTCDSVGAIRRIRLLHGLPILLEPAAVHQIQDAIHIELPLSHVLPQPTAEFLIRQLELSASQVACRGEKEILLVIPGALIAQECGLDGLEKCHGQRCLFVQHE